MTKPVNRPHRPRGHRPSGLTPEVSEAFLAEIGKGLTLADACSVTGLSWNTVKKWVERGRGTSDRPQTPEYVAFVAGITKARADMKAKLHGYVFEAAATNPDIAMRLLDRMDPQWGRPEPDEVEEDEDDFRTPLLVAGQEADGDLPVQPSVTLRERERTISIPLAQVAEFAAVMRGEDHTDDPDLSQFRETAT